MGADETGVGAGSRRMDLVFSGHDERTLDEKGRLAVPAAFRKVLARMGDDGLVLLASPRKPKLVAYPRSVFVEKLERIERQIAELEDNHAQPSDIEKYAVIRDYIAHNAEQAPLDRAGRILVPPALRTQANIDGRVVVAGNFRFFEIWQPEAWHAYMRQVRSAGTLAALSGMGL